MHSALRRPWPEPGPKRRCPSALSHIPPCSVLVLALKAAVATAPLFYFNALTYLEARCARWWVSAAHPSPACLPRPAAGPG